MDNNCMFCQKMLTKERMRMRSIFCGTDCRIAAQKQKYRDKHPLKNEGRLCTFCGQSMPENNHAKKFCSSDCRKQFSAQQFKRLNPRISLSSGTVGAINELKVAIDLLRKGYAVFRALSPSCPCDLAILTSSVHLIRVEVTTGSYTVKGKISYPAKDSSKHDLLAVVMPDEKIIYSGKFKVRQ